MYKNRVIMILVLIFYGLFFMDLSIKNAMFKKFCNKFISLFKNREIGETLFVILFYLIPACLIIWGLGIVLEIIGKKLRRKK